MDSEEKSKVLAVYPEYDTVHGPYKRKQDDRSVVVLCSKDSNSCTTRQLAKVRLEVKLGRRLVNDETVDHEDLDRTNDSPENLRILGRVENARRSAIDNKHSLGRIVPMESRSRGEKSGKAKLTNEQVGNIRESFSSGLVTKEALMATLGMSDKGVRNMLYGASYADVPNAVKPRSWRSSRA